MLNYVLEHDLDNLTEEQLGEMLSFANAAAAICHDEKRGDPRDAGKSGSVTFTRTVKPQAGKGRQKKTGRRKR